MIHCFTQLSSQAQELSSSSLGSSLPDLEIPVLRALSLCLYTLGSSCLCLEWLTGDQAPLTSSVVWFLELVADSLLI